VESQRWHEGQEKLARLKKLLDDHGIEVQGIAVHGNPVHPDKRIAKAHQTAHRNGILLAAEFTTVLINFSGCPGGCATDKTPNFVTCPWPDEFAKAAEYQWNKVMIPFWSSENKFAAKHGVKIAFEAHPGMVVHTPEDIARLRKAAGKNLGANIDPSHWFWQGIDPVAATRYLGQNKCIFHAHAKDCEVYKAHEGHDGDLDIKIYSDGKDIGRFGRMHSSSNQTNIIIRKKVAEVIIDHLDSIFLLKTRGP
jgi:sugar phosphate isomerase/epimerase